MRAFDTLQAAEERQLRSNVISYNTAMNAAMTEAWETGGKPNQKLSTEYCHCLDFLFMNNLSGVGMCPH